MSWARVTHRTLGGEAYVLQRADDLALVFTRRSREIAPLDPPGQLAGRGDWVEFDGDEAPILAEAEAAGGLEAKPPFS